jgi:hypothetical protein
MADFGNYRRKGTPKSKSKEYNAGPQAVGTVDALNSFKV